MINTSIQKKIGWCSVHTLQNIFLTNKLNDYLKDPKYEGCQDKEVEELLSEIDDTLGVENVLYVNQVYTPLPVAYVWDVLNKKDEIIGDFSINVLPYLLTVRLADMCFHHVAVLNIDGKIWYSDPYREKWNSLETWLDLNSMFRECYGVQRFYIKATKSWTILNGEYWGYDKFDF